MSRIEPPKSNTFSKWVQAAESASNLLITDPYNSDNEADDDHDLLLARRIRNRSGSLTDVDLMPESDLPSGSEEAGYEVSGFFSFIFRER